MRALFLLIVITPILELWLLFKVGSFIGFSATILLILATAIAGATLLRLQGFSTLFRARQKMSEGKMPAHEMAEGLMLAFAGALMLTPGFATDTLGFLLLIPGVRKTLIKQFKDKINFAQMNMPSGEHSASNHDDGVIIEGEFHNESHSSHEKLR